MAKNQKSDEVIEQVSNPKAPARDIQGLLSVNVCTKGIDRRCRAGLAFGKVPVNVKVTPEQLALLKADNYLQVEDAAEA